MKRVGVDGELAVGILVVILGLGRSTKFTMGSDEFHFRAGCNDGGI